MLNVSFANELCGLTIDKVQIFEVPCRDSKHMLRFSFRASEARLNFFSALEFPCTEEEAQVFVESHITSIVVETNKIERNMWNPYNWFLRRVYQTLVLEFSNDKYIEVEDAFNVEENSCEAHYAERL